jgi:hypothetical protein
MGSARRATTSDAAVLCCFGARCAVIGPGFSRMIERAAAVAKLGIKAHAHMLRHACSFKLANDGVATGSRRAYLGHRNIQHSGHRAHAESVQGVLAGLTPPGLGDRREPDPKLAPSFRVVTNRPRHQRAVLRARSKQRANNIQATSNCSIPGNHRFLPRRNPLNYCAASPALSGSRAAPPTSVCFWNLPDLAKSRRAANSGEQQHQSKFLSQ